MKLPNADQAIVEREKIQDYLLDATHPDNGGKAQFFEQLGFHRSKWKVLADAFLVLARSGKLAQSLKSPHGQKYVIVGRIKAAGGKSALVQTIWIVDKGRNAAKLVTAYPHKE
jgi:hypothetical protein